MHPTCCKLPSTSFGNGSNFFLPHQRSSSSSIIKKVSLRVIRAHQEVLIIANPNKNRESRIQLPELSVQGIPHSDYQIHEIVRRQQQSHNHNSFSSRNNNDVRQNLLFHPMFLEEAYQRCKNICAEYAKTFYLGTHIYIHIHIIIFNLL